MVDRISTLDSGYQTGQLSLFPMGLDTPHVLYQVKNGAETVLGKSLGYGSQYIVVTDTSPFPPQGLIRVGLELVYYDSKTSDTFLNLKRGFAGSQQNQWPIGTKVTASVMAEPHNAVKDALINIEHDLGIAVNPVSTSLNGILIQLENRFLAPKPIFRAYPRKGPAAMVVKFQNFSTGVIVRYLWEFGDGATSLDVAPTHTYGAEGTYTVKLSVITSLGAQGITTKTDYITVDNNAVEGFYYVTPAVGSVGQTFTFIDQTVGDVSSRYWIFDDGTTLSELDPDIHTATHVYSAAGMYSTALIVVFADQSLRRYVIDPIVVT